MSPTWFLGWLCSATLWLSVMTLMAAGLLRWSRVRHAAVHRTVWGIVLASGIVCGVWRAEIPWYEATSIATASSDAPGLIDRLAATSDRSIRSVAGRRATSKGASESRGLGGALGDREVPWRMMLLSVWLGGLVWVSFGGIHRYMSWRRRVDSFSPAPPDWQCAWDAALRRMGCRRHVPMLCSESDGPLLTWHRRGYVVVVPSLFWASRSAAARRSILEHEAAHLVRRDVPRTALFRALVWVHWFNPLAWFALRRYEEATEWSCDDLVRRSDPRSVLILARSLLELSGPAAPRLGVRSVSGSLLGKRLRRLIDPQMTREESKMKRMLLLTLAMLLLAGGAVRFELVPLHSQEPAAPGRPSIDWEARAKALSQELPAGDALIDRFRTMLRTDAGAAVLREVLADETEAARREYRRQVVPQLIREKLAGKDAAATAFQQRFVRAVQTAEGDLKAIHKAFHDLAERFSTATPLDRLARRFLQHDGAQLILYFEGLLPRLRPTEQMVLERLGEVFAVDNDYRYFIRSSHAEEAARAARRGVALSQQTKLIRAELLEYAKEFSDESELDRRFKSALADPLLPAFVTALLFNSGDRPAEEAVDEFFEHLNGLVVDTDKGLSVVGKERQAEVKEILQRFKQARQAMPRVQEALTRFADKIRDKGETEKAWKTLLKSPTGQILFSLELELPPADPGAGATAILMTFIAEGADGKLHINVGDRSPEEVQEQLSGFFRGFRSLRREGRKIDRQAESLPEGPVKAALQTLPGKALIIQEARRLMRTNEQDVWSKWLREHFPVQGDGRVVSERSREMIQGMLDRAADIEKELAHDDF